MTDRDPDGPVRWYTLEEAGEICRRNPRTLANLISRYQLPRRRLWKTFRFKRRRVVFLSPTTVRWLQQITLEGKAARELQKPMR